MDTPKYGTAFPNYCPSDLRDDQICPRCGADPANYNHYCRARRNGPEPKPLVEIVLIDRRQRP